MKISKRVENMIEAKNAFAVNMPIPQTQLVLDINSNCNQACIFCAYLQNRVTKYMPESLTYRLIDEGAKLGIKELQLSISGEPFLNPSLNDYICAAKKAGYEYICLSTNGMERKLEVYQNAIEAGLTSIKFSIHAASPTAYKQIHGVDNFDSVISTVKQLGIWKKEFHKKFLIFVFCTSTRFTEKDGEKLKELLGDYVDEVAYYPVLENSVRTKGIREYLYPTESHTYDFNVSTPMKICTHPFKRIYVSVEGYMMPCCADHHGYCNLVDLNQCSLEEGWNSEIFREFRRRHIENDLDNTFCNFCKHQQDSYDFAPIDSNLCQKIDFSKFNITSEFKNRFLNT